MPQNNQWNSNNCNNFNNFNNLMNCMNNMGFPNQNMPMQGMNIGGAIWKNLYDTNNQANMQNIIQNQNDRVKGRVNVIFRTTRGIKIIIFIEFGKTVSELLQIYFKRVDRPDLFFKPNDICFIHNANRIDFNDQTPVENYFGVGAAMVTVNDMKGLIGAKYIYNKLKNFYI